MASDLPHQRCQTCSHWRTLCERKRAIIGQCTALPQRVILRAAYAGAVYKGRRGAPIWPEGIALTPPE